MALKVLKRLKIQAASQYKKGDFGYWWTVEQQEKDIEGKSYNDSISCEGSDITSLKGCPKTVNGDFDCSGNALTSLKGAPEKIDGSFDCSGNSLTSLEGGPKIVNDYYTCTYNELKSLKGAPEKIGEDFNCEDNQLKNLEGAPKAIGGYLLCNHNPLTSLDGYNGDLKNLKAPKKLIEDLEKAKAKFKTASDLINFMLKNKNKIDLKDENLSFVLVKLEPKNFSDSSKYKKFFEQLKNENKLGWYATQFVRKGDSPKVESLPIFGNSNSYVTKWFSSDPISLLKKDIKEYSILNRV